MFFSHSRHHFRGLCIVMFLVFTMQSLIACHDKRDTGRVVTPWGEIGADSIPLTDDFTLSDMVQNGELIMLTISGPETYYDYRGRGMGLQYLLCERFARRMGVSVRVELCRDTVELLSRLHRGDADLIAYMLPERLIASDSLMSCGVKNDSLQLSWAVLSSNTELADSLNSWYRPSLYAEVRLEEARLLTSGRVRRRVFSPMLNRSKGQISRYDHLFVAYAPTARLDWRLLAAQCYQESTFDPNARSWAGACGLMQIMPSTADHLGLSRDKLFDPEMNIAAAARYMAELMNLFRDIPAQTERISFALACYNGGYHHIRDAMALARKDGHDARRWADVVQYVLRLREPQYYNDPVVKHGYMRGNETVDYVEKIHARWADYRGVARPRGGMSGGTPSREPQKAKHKHRFHI